MMDRTLGSLFLADAPEPPPASTDEASLAATLDAYVHEARRAWPQIAIDDREFVRYVAARSTGGRVPPIEHAADMLLAYGCARRDAAAAAAFHDAYKSVIARVLSRRRAKQDLADDATQAVHERLLVGAAGTSPKIAEYRGNGPLRSWVSTTTATTLLMTRRAAARRREQSDDAVAASVFKQEDSELAHMKARYTPHMNAAIVEALEKLEDREKTLLRLHLGERMSIDHLGAMYGVNRATAARWLAAVRKRLVEGAREHLRARLRLSDSECDSIVVLVRSELDLSIVRHLS